MPRYTAVSYTHLDVYKRQGVYNHIAGDGREYVITDDSAVKLRAEDGRSIQKADISMFIQNLPNGKNTTEFYTEDASGSTSQAANTVEAMEAGSTLFLIDEDTSATNFMIRDELMHLSLIHILMIFCEEFRYNQFFYLYEVFSFVDYKLEKIYRLPYILSPCSVYP